jgi:hypothetical protein
LKSVIVAHSIWFRQRRFRLLGDQGILLVTNSMQVCSLSPLPSTPYPISIIFLVLYHHGKYATGGHYTVDVLRQSQPHSEWIRIDDTHIDPLKEEDVAVTATASSSTEKDKHGEKRLADKTAYLLFYQRVTDEVVETGKTADGAHTPTGPKMNGQAQKRPPRM